MPWRPPSGYTYFIPSEERLESKILTRGFMETRMVVALAGRCVHKLYRKNLTVLFQCLEKLLLVAALTVALLKLLRSLHRQYSMCTACWESLHGRIGLSCGLSDMMLLIARSASPGGLRYQSNMSKGAAPVDIPSILRWTGILQLRDHTLYLQRLPLS